MSGDYVCYIPVGERSIVHCPAEGVPHQSQSTSLEPWVPQLMEREQIDPTIRTGYHDTGANIDPTFRSCVPWTSHDRLVAVGTTVADSNQDSRTRDNVASSRRSDKMEHKDRIDFRSKPLYPTREKKQNTSEEGYHEPPFTLSLQRPTNRILIQA